MAQPAHPVAARTTLPGCAGILTLSTRARSLNRLTPCSREPSTTRHGTDTKCWTLRKSQPQPHLEVTITARREDFRQHGHTLRQETQALTLDAMADTGCQSCLAGPQLLARLHLTEADLIPVNLIMHSANGDDLPILGAILRITASITGQETRQMVYFSHIASKLYLRLATCIDLMLLPNNFPHGTAIRETATRTHTSPTRPLAEHAVLQTAATPSQPRGNQSGRGHQGSGQGHQGSGQGHQGSGQGRDIKAQGRDIKAQGRDIKAQGRDIKAQGRDIKAQGRNIKAHHS